MGRSRERDSGGDAGVAFGATDKSKVSLGAASEDGGYGFTVCLDFSFEFREIRVGGVAADFCQRCMLEVSLPVVGGVGVRHGVCCRSTRGSPVLTSQQALSLWCKRKDHTKLSLLEL